MSQEPKIHWMRRHYGQHERFGVKGKWAVATCGYRGPDSRFALGTAEVTCKNCLRYQGLLPMRKRP